VRIVYPLFSRQCDSSESASLTVMSRRRLVSYLSLPVFVYIAQVCTVVIGCEVYETATVTVYAAGFCGFQCLIHVTAFYCDISPFFSRPY